MCTKEDNVSPYLRRPARTYEQFLRDQAMRIRRMNRRVDPPTGPSTRDLPNQDEDYVEPCQ